MNNPKITTDNNSFCIEIDNNTNMDKVNELMDLIQDEYIKEANKLSKQLNVSEETANCIIYLRSRSRWTQELENQLIDADKNNRPISMSKVLSGEF